MADNTFQSAERCVQSGSTHHWAKAWTRFDKTAACQASDRFTHDSAANAVLGHQFALGRQEAAVAKLAGGDIRFDSGHHGVRGASSSARGPRSKML
ncbi:hypothetical protein MPL3365_370029 [Mesorhizobium plurifarium]|uniref:Uncharacterized protein n=1 Tax=Mesorhizobium plurifarium TaxID=69974 RepID=A0A090G9S6_MESPL|nr:hypothetical protein MPL3365_370029 [Mesorhizobium plurifarium]